MNILLYGFSFGKTTNMFINNEIKYLSEKHNVKCLCREYFDDFKIDNVSVVHYDRTTLKEKIRFRLYQSDWSLSFKNKAYAKQANKIIDDFKPDIIHCHFAYEALMLLDNIKETNIPIIIHFHGYGASQCIKRKSYVQKMKNIIAQKNVFPIYVSDFMKQNLENVGIMMDRGIKLYYGINLNHFNPEDKQENQPFTFLQVSSLVEKKGIDYTIKAFGIFMKDKNKEDYQLILTGEDDKKLPILKNLVKELNIEECVIFYGNANREEVKQLMNNANVFVHHSITAKNGDQEGIPNAIMEAMAMKLPVLSTIHAGIPELVKDGVNGYLVKERDVTHYAERMNDVLTWKKKDENRAVIEDRFNMIKHNHALEQFYLSKMAVNA